MKHIGHSKSQMAAIRFHGKMLPIELFLIVVKSIRKTQHFNIQQNNTNESGYSVEWIPPPLATGPVWAHYDVQT